nr:uncharacterized protein LOC128698164 [Cherax quadricarinatus]
MDGMELEVRRGKCLAHPVSGSLRSVVIMTELYLCYTSHKLSTFHLLHLDVHSRGVGETGREWSTWLKKELTWKRELVLIKVIQFLYSGGTSSFLPYLTLHMQQLGLSVMEIATIYTVLPVASILGPPISGLVADRCGRFKAVVVLNMVLTVILHCLLLYVPARLSPTLKMSCGPQGHVLTWSSCLACHQHLNSTQQQLTFQVISNLTVRNLTFCALSLSTTGNHDNITEYENAPSSDFVPKIEFIAHKNIRKKEHRTHEVKYVKQIYVLQSCEFECSSPPSEVTVCLHADQYCDCHNYTLTDQITINGTLLSWREKERCYHTWSDLVYDDHLYHSLTCSPQCSVECQVTQVPQCHLPDHLSHYSNTFWIYLILRVLATFFLNSLFTMMDAVTLAVVKQHEGDYGKQRFMFILGLATVPLLAGLFLDWRYQVTGYKDYTAAFYLGGVLCLVSASLITRLCFSVESSSKRVVSDLTQLATRPEVDVYLLMVLVMGSNWGFLESYLFLYLETLHAPSYLMGLTFTVGSVVGMPVMLVADAVVEKIGRPNTFIISFFVYAIRHFGYSHINDPWLVLPFEVLELFTYQLMWVAAITYCPILAPKGLLATMTGITGSVHFSLGRGLGSLVGGYLIDNLDLPGAFRGYAGIAATSGVLYALIHFGCIKKKLTIREEEIQEENGQQQTRENRPVMEEQVALPLLPINQNIPDSSI